MEDMDVDDMDVDTEVDLERRRRAAEKLDKRFGAGMQGPSQAHAMNLEQAKGILRKLGELVHGRKITEQNAFDLEGIEALRVLVFQEDASASARCGEGHFQNAGMGLDIGVNIYSKRVDAVHKLAFNTLAGSGTRGEKAAEEADDEDAEKDQQEGGEEGEEDETKQARNKKRQAAFSADITATLCADSKLRQREKEPTFDLDPFFVRTSRLIDENSPQGLLLHNLPVLTNGHIAFDSSVKAQPAWKKPAGEAGPDAVLPLDTGAILIDLSGLPGAKKLLAAVSAAPAPLCPGIDELYGMLQDRFSELPGLQVAAEVDPEDLLRKALAENQRDRLDAHRNAVVRQVVRQAEDAMDVDMAEAGGDDGAGGSGASGQGAHDVGIHKHDGDIDHHAGGPSHDDEDDGDGGFGGAGSDGGYGSPGLDGLGAGAGGGDDGGGGSAGGSDVEEGGRQAGGRGGSRDLDSDADGDGHSQSDDESAVLSLLGGLTASGLSGAAGASQTSWWKSQARKKAAAAGAKTRVRKPKPDEVALDWGSTPQPLLEDSSAHCFKTTRSEATTCLCLPSEEPAQPEELRGFFTAHPLALATSSTSGLQTGAGAAGASVGFDLNDAWVSLLQSDITRDRQMRRQMRAGGRTLTGAGGRPSLAAGGGGAGTPFGRPSGGAAGPTMSGTDGMYDDGLGGGMGMDDAGGGAAGQFDGEYGGGVYDDDDAGLPVGSGGLTDDDEEDQEGAGLPGPFPGGRGPTLEELLQPPRRLKRTTIKFDRTAGLADVATLKSNIEKAMKRLAISQRQPSLAAVAAASPAPSPATLPFQTILDELSTQAATATKARAAVAAGAPNRGSDPLAGVSTHLAFICLLHLANENNLALSTGGNLDTLVVTGLGNLGRGTKVGA